MIIFFKKIYKELFSQYLYMPGRYGKTKLKKSYKFNSKKFNKKVKTARQTNVLSNLYYFKRKVAPGTQVNLTTTNRSNIQFGLDQVPGYTDFTGLFDQYMISGVKVEFRLVLDPAAQAFGQSIYPNLYVRRDFDNTTSESVSEIAQDNRSKRFILQPNKPASIYIKPAVLNEYYDINTALSIRSPVFNRWIDCTTPAFPHLGIKWAIDTMGIPMPAGTTMTIEYTYYLKLKNTR